MLKDTLQGAEDDAFMAGGSDGEDNNQGNVVFHFASRIFLGARAVARALIALGAGAIAGVARRSIPAGQQGACLPSADGIARLLYDYFTQRLCRRPVSVICFTVDRPFVSLFANANV